MRHPEALDIARDIAARLLPHTERLKIAGSVRRGAAEVKDIELVALADVRLWEALDSMVAAGRIEKALYGSSTRWGQKYRGFVYRGIKVEVFTAVESTWGYQYWLRTGPGSKTNPANTVLVTAVKRGAPFSLRDGAVWYQNQLLHIPDEAAFFKLCGLPYIAPHERSAALYRQLLANHRWGNPPDYLPAPPLQQSLFSLDQFIEMEWQAAQRHGSPGRTVKQVPFRWRAPWLRADGLVWAYVVKAGEGRWEALPPSDPRALRYRQACLDGELPSGGLFVGSEQLRLESFLYPVEAKLDALLKELVYTLRSPEYA